jgi:DNA-directed RNA polymerase subunit RPC12/RpoP
MALIKCPECGKEISDKAGKCPHCGYPIEEYLARERQKELYKIKFNSITMPDKPEKEKEWFILMGLGVLSIILGFATSDGVTKFAGVFLILASIYARESNYRMKMKKYNLAVTDMEKYRRKILEEQQKAEEELVNSLIKCPNCGSTDTKKISTTSKVASVAMVGIASGKIGKQYQCKKCGYKW